jgi:hypothetical protein
LLSAKTRKNTASEIVQTCTNAGIALNTAQTISSIAQQIVTQKYCESLDFTLTVNDIYTQFCNIWTNLDVSLTLNAIKCYLKV